MEVESSFQKLSLEEKSSLDANNMGYKFLPNSGCRTRSASSKLWRMQQEMARKLREQRQEQLEKSDQGIEEESDEDEEESDEDEEESGEDEELSCDEALALRWKMLERRAEKMRSTNKKKDSDLQKLMRNNLNQPSCPGLTIPVYF